MGSLMTTKPKDVVERIIMLVEEIALLKSKYTDHDTGHLRTAVSVLEHRVQELKENVH